jgi:GNAT superfamily N-acetyltransferase
VISLALPGNQHSPAATPAVVRTATQADEGELLQLLHLMHSEGGLVELDEDRARQMFVRAFNREGGHIIGVIGDKKIEAAIGLVISQFWYGASHHIEEYFCYVHPDHRRSQHAKALLGFAKRCSKALQIPLLIGVLSNRRTASKVRLYRSQLGASVGEFFLFNHPWKQAGAEEKPRVRIPAVTAPMPGIEERAS